MTTGLQRSRPPRRFVLRTGALRGGVRAVVPSVFLPLCLVASVLSATPWLRSFPSSIAAVPMYGAALLSVLLPLAVVRIKPRWLWPSLLIDAAVFAAYTLVVVLRDPVAVGPLGHGLLRGPSEILTFALPLVSPRDLMVAPVALIWLAGALAGECLARRWYTLLPYVGFLVAFALAYAGTQRAAGTDPTSSRSYEPLLAAGLLGTLLLMRVAQAWVRQDETAESTQPDGILPLRGLLVGAITALVITLVAVLAVRSDAFPKRADTPQRVPSIDQSRPLSPLAFVAGLRPRTARDPGRPVFSVTTDSTSPGYFPIANMDFYDGAGWSFDRTFRPSGGVLPDDTDPALRSHEELSQQYRIAPGPLAGAPWMPFSYRAQKVTGAAVDIDPASGMIAPAANLAAGTTYRMRSSVTPITFDRVRTRTATPDTATPTIDTQLPGSLRSTLDEVVQALGQETHTPTTPSLPFLQALQRDLRTNYTLSTAARGSATGAVSPSTPAATPSTPAKSSSTARHHHPRDLRTKPLPGSKHKPTPPTHRQKPTHAANPAPTPSPTPTSSAAGPAGDLAGSTGFADVLASILGPNRSGTPEQFATLMALVARDLGVPARVVTGFRVQPAAGADVLAPGRYGVTTADAWTWAEVPLNGVGWVALDATPARFSADKKPTESGAPPPSSSSAPPSQNPLITQGSNGNAAAPPSKIPHSTSTPEHVLLIAILIAIALLILAVIVVLATRKRVRAAKRRRSPDPRERVIGAWRENLDVLAEAGLPDLSAFTSTEIAHLTGEQFGAGPGADSAALGAAANLVAYSTSVAIADDDAAQAWARQRSVRKQVLRQLGFRGRVAAGLRYHRHARASMPVSPESWAGSPSDDDGRGSARRRRRAH